MIYGEPETSQFLAAVARIKQHKRSQDKTREARQRLRAVVRKLRKS